MKYCRRVLNKQRAKVSGMYDIPNRVIRLRVSLKITVFSMETPCWSSSDELHHGCRKPMETPAVYFGSLKTFFCSHLHRHFSQHIGCSELENIRLIDIFVHVTCYPVLRKIIA